MKYCPSVHQTKRWLTRAVKVGCIGVGGSNPIRIQSMTTSNTRDVESTVSQVMLLADKGCEIVRVTVQGRKEADACEEIKNSLIRKGYQTPLVADIHFYPPAAMRVVDFVDKVRINPGNFFDKRATFKTLVYTDESYLQELQRIEEEFSPLVLKCRALKRAMRIGTNHGSLSDRIMNRFGDTPQGMVESALEYARICRKHDFHDFIFSMKASNPKVMIQAYRLLVAEMMKLGWDYPLHLGVTEAGEGEDGRIKSAVGMGSLLLDGLGDTIRVSLTEDPWYEIDPCQRLVKLAESYQGKGIDPFEETTRDILSLVKRECTISSPLHPDGSVGINLKHQDIQQTDIYSSLGCQQRSLVKKKEISSVDFVLIHDNISLDHPVIASLKNRGIGVFSLYDEKAPVVPLEALETHSKKHAVGKLFSSFDQEHSWIVTVSDEGADEWEQLKHHKIAFILLQPKLQSRIHYARKFFDWMKKNEVQIPVILNFTYEEDWDDVLIRASAEIGSLLCDGLGEGILLEGPYTVQQIRQLSFNILQACRLRTVKTDFISCPSCGRTLFNLQEVSERIRQKTGHLPGVKIAIMGCIVNGPGEMADADFGYVGSKAGKVDLYIGKECVEKDIDHLEADERLIMLIKEHGKWIEPGLISEEILTNGAQ